MERLLYTLATTPDGEALPLIYAILSECARRGISPADAVKGFGVRVRFLVLNYADCQGLSLADPSLYSRLKPQVEAKLRKGNAHARNTNGVQPTPIQ